MRIRSASLLATSYLLLGLAVGAEPPDTVTGKLVWESGKRGEDGGYALLIPHPTPWAEVDRYHLALEHARGRDAIAARLDRFHAMGIAVDVTVTGRVVPLPQRDDEAILIVDRCLTQDP